MKNWSTRKIVLFVAVCVILNVVGKLIVVALELPLWADSFGTALCAYLGGPVCGALAGLTGNLAYCVINRLSAAYSITSIGLGIIVGIAARYRWFDRFYGFMKAASLSMLTALVVSVPINIILDNGYTGNKWGDGVINYLMDKEWPFFLCCVLGQLSIEFADKVLTIAAVYIVILLRRYNRNRNKEKALQQGSAVGTALILCFSLTAAFTVPVKGDAQPSAETTD